MDLSHVKAAAREFFVPGEQRRRLLMTLSGVLTCCFSVAFLRQSGFGTDPFQCFCNGLALVIPIDFGTLAALISLVLLTIVALLDRHFIGVATVINVFFFGYITDFSEYLLYSAMGDPTMAMRVIYLAVGFVSMCFASALYFTSDLGVSAYDFFALYLSKIQKKAPFRFVRIFTDVICVVAGFVMGYIPGAGTLITACFMGPLVSFFNHTVAEPMRYGRRKHTR